VVYEPGAWLTTAQRVVESRESERPVVGVIFPRFGGRSDYAANAAICDLNSNSIGLT
jgi:hypothetical protein